MYQTLNYLRRVIVKFSEIYNHKINTILGAEKHIILKLIVFESLQDIPFCMILDFIYLIFKNNQLLNFN